MPVSQMSAVREIHSQHGGAGLERGHVDANIRLRAEMRLSVRVFRAKKLLCPPDSEPLDAVNILATAVIPFARISLGIFVSEDRARGFENSFRNEIFGRDELQPSCLPGNFVATRFCHLGIDFVE